MELVARRPAVRAANLAKLRAEGFAPVDWFPLREHRAVVRPNEEIAQRTLAIAAAWAWSALSENEIPTPILRAHVDRNDLGAAMTEPEKELFQQARGAWANDAAPLLCATAALAFVLGFATEPSLRGTAPSQEALRDLLRFVLRGGDVATLDLASRQRADRDVVEQEDLFACAHQTGRLALLGHPEARMPTDASFTGIEASRHALSWCLSPGESWETVDLST